MAPRLGSLCSGYGGLDLAVNDIFGTTTAWHCENLPAAAAVLDHRFPGVPNLGDLREADFRDVEPVDVLAAGFPCQDVSIAGPRDGMTADNRSGLWKHVARAIDVLNPEWVVIENVRGLISQRAFGVLESCPGCLGDENRVCLRALGAVLGDLADLRFDAEWVCLRASEAGAPHRRDRTFILARRPAAEDADVEHRKQRRDAAPGQEEAGRTRADPRGRGGVGTAADAVSLEPERCGAAGELARPAPAEPGQEDQRERAGDAAGGRGPDADDPGCGIVWGRYEPAIRKWERLTGRPAPCPIGWVKTGRRISPYFVEWMMGLDEGWVTGVPGISRTKQFTLLGNGVVPQQAKMALRVLRQRYEIEDVVTEEAVQLLFDLPV